MVRPYFKNKWVTKDNKILDIKDMETSHIKNTIDYLIKHNDFYGEYYFDGYTCDGDGDGQIYDYVNNQHLVKYKIQELEEELNRRN